MSALGNRMRFTASAYPADHCRTSAGCVRMAALVNCFRMSGSSGGMRICWAQNMVSGSGIALSRPHRRPGTIRCAAGRRQGSAQRPGSASHRLLRLLLGNWGLTALRPRARDCGVRYPGNQSCAGAQSWRAKRGRQPWSKWLVSYSPPIPAEGSAMFS